MSINRATEAMTLFAVICALQFPLFHTGRPWLAAYWLLPVSQTRWGIWPNFRTRSSGTCIADVTYGTISAVFWFTGSFRISPPCATARGTGPRGSSTVSSRWLWRGVGAHWRRYETCLNAARGPVHAVVLSVHHRGEASTSPCRSSPAGTHARSRPTSSPAPIILGLPRWCSRCSSDPGRPLQASRAMITGAAPRRRWRGHAGHGPVRLYGT